MGCGFRFQDTFDNRHPQYAGDVGIGINPELAQRVRDADLVLALGVRLGEMTTGGYTLLEPPRPTAALVHVHAGAEELGRVYAADLLRARVDGVRRAGARGARRRRRDAAGRAWTEAAHADYEANLVADAGRAARHGRGGPHDPAHVPADTVYTNGAGNFSGWLHRFHRYRACSTPAARSSRRPRARWATACRRRWRRRC